MKNSGKVYGVNVGSNEDGKGGANGGEVSLIDMALTGVEGAANQWMSRGLCADVPDDERDWWYGETPSQEEMELAAIGNTAGLNTSRYHTLLALRICSSCPVQRECMDYAMEQAEMFGVWGGLTEKQRGRLGGWGTNCAGAAGRAYPGQRTKDWSEVRDVVTPPKVLSVSAVIPGRGSQRPEGLCRSGRHEWTPENTFHDGAGVRCRLCRREARRGLERNRKLAPELLKRARPRALTEFAEEYKGLELSTKKRQDAARLLGMKPSSFDRAVSRARKAGLL